MFKFEQIITYLRLLLFLPFFIIALIPRGLMLSPKPTNLGELLVICPSSLNGHNITMLKHDAHHHHHANMEYDGTAQTTETTAYSRDHSCLYSIANSAYLVSASITAVLNASIQNPSLLAQYIEQYLFNFYPAGFPRGPPQLF